MALIRPALVIVGSLSVLTGLAYPLVVTGISQAAFPRQARGSLIVRNGQVTWLDPITLNRAASGTSAMP